MYTLASVALSRFLRGSLVICVFAILAAGCGGNRSEQYRLEADAYLSLGKVPEAEDLYRKAIEADAANGMAAVGLGRCLAAEGKVDEALAAFEGVMKAAPSTGAAYVEAANLHLTQGRTDAAIETAGKYASVDEMQGGLLTARLLLLTGKPDDAAKLLTGLSGKDAKSADIHTLLGMVLIAQGDHAKAEEEFRLVLGDISSDSVAAWMGLVEASGPQGKAAAVIEELERIAAQNPNNYDLKAALARAYVEAGRLDDGESAARGVVGQNPASGWTNYAMGSVLLKKGDVAGAAQYLERATSALPQEFCIRRDVTLARQQRPEQVPAPGEGTDTARQTPSTASEDGSWQTLWKQASLKRLLDGREQFLAAGGENLREVLVVSAVFRGNPALAEDLAKELPADSPLHTYIKALKDRKPEEIVKSLEPWLKRSDELGLIGQNALGYAMALSGVRSRALQLFYACNRNWPDNAVSLFNGAQAFRMAGMSRYAAQAYARIIAQYPDNPDGYVLHFLALREAGSAQDARRSAEAGYALFPDVPEIALNLSQAYLDARLLDDAKQLLTRAVEAAPDDPGLKIGLATVELHAANSGETLRLVEGLEGPQDSMNQAVLLETLAHLTSGNWQGAIEKAALLPEGRLRMVGRVIAAAAHLKNGQPGEAAVSHEETGAQGPAGGRAGLVILHALGKTAPELANADDTALAQLLAKDPALLADFAYGTACQMAELNDEAFAAYERVVAKATDGSAPLLPLLFATLSKSVRTTDTASRAREIALRHESVPAAWVGLAAFLRATDDVAGEREALDKAAQAGPNEPQVHLQRGIYFETQGDLAAAQEEYRRLLELRPDDPIGNNNLAYCLLSSNSDAEEARGHALRAAEALPNDAHVMHTLGVAELRTGALAESEKHLQGALELMPGEPTLLLDYGLLLVAKGMPAEGRIQAQAALSYAQLFGLEFPRRAEAEDLLEKIPAPALPMPQANAASPSTT
ncbi:MAG: tetratricopeptide repeat protein [Candidatus Hydrogenedentes bacterium]|nr:tetratricopeptide repeat protein [Candidatus Hydrogenedentota bacterium]